MASPTTITDSYNEAAADKISVNGYPFQRYKEQDLENLGYSHFSQAELDKTISTYEKHVSTLRAVKNGTYNPNWNDGIPYPTEGENIFQKVKETIEQKLKNNLSEITDQLPPDIRNDKVLQMALAVDGAIDRKINYNDKLDNIGGRDDHWAHPYTTLERGEGDCDDYATTKRKMLRDMGVPDNQVFILSGKDGQTGGGHATCMVIGDNGKAYIIDNSPPDKPPKLIPLDDYIKKYDFQVRLIMGDDSVFAIKKEDFENIRKEREISPPVAQRAVQNNFAI